MECPKCKTDNPSDSKFCKECATPLPSSKEIPVTETLETPKEELTTGSLFAGRYQIIEELGKGGMGKVYRVLDKELNEEVALKLIKPEIAADKKIIERFKNELKLARKIGHRNVGRMYELLEHKGSHFITMEYVSGQDLKGLIRQSGQLATGTAISIAKQVCEGLTEAHRLGVIHRDLKPRNIMIDREGNARIMDFGIARSIKGKGITGAGVMVGTPEYMSPEQVEGKDADQRSDVYSLGIILYEMVTGRVPFEGDTPLSVAVKQKTETPPDPQNINSQIPDELNRVILKSLEKDKKDRFESVEQVLAELRNIEKEIPSTERILPRRRPATSREITVTFNLKKLLIPSAVIALAIIAAIIWQPWSRKETVPIPSDKPALAILRFANNTGDEGLNQWRSALSELLIHDLDQSKYVYVLPNDRLLDILAKFDLENSENYSYEDLHKIASWSGFNQIVTGQYYKFGDNIRVNITLQDASTGEIIGRESAEGKGEDSLFGIVDELTRKIKTLVKLPVDKISSDLDMAIGDIITSSPEAYKFFSEGTKLYFKTEYEKAIPLLENAVALDPGLTLAYRHLAAIHNNLGNASEQKRYQQKAYESADRASEKVRLLVQGGYYYFVQNDFDKSFETYKKLVQLYPDDTLGNRMLGLWYQMGFGDTESSVKHTEIAYRNYPESAIDCANLAQCYTLLGRINEAGEILEHYLKDFPDNPVVRRRLVENLIHRKKYDTALAELDKLFRLAPTRWNYALPKGDIYFLMGELSKAEHEYKTLFEAEDSSDQLQGLFRLFLLYRSHGKFENSKNMLAKIIETARQHGQKGWEATAHANLSYLHLQTGNYSEALNERKKAKKMAAERNNIGRIRRYLRREAEIYISLKSMAEAERASIELRESLEKERNKREFRFYHWIIGKIEFEKENFEKAVENFEHAISLSYPFMRAFSINDYITYLEPLAKTYFRTGSLEKAREEYEKIISNPTARRDFGDIYAKSFYMLGQICEQQGKKTKAIENYERFLELWKDADPGISEVEDAKTKLEALKK